jgi:DNA repair protein RadD
MERFSAGVRRVLLQLPTGAGKTVVAADLLLRFVAEGKRALFIAPRRELIEQTCRKLDVLGLEYGVMAEDRRVNLYAPVQVASIDTLRARYARHGQLPLLAPHLVIVDECHLYVTKKRVEILGLWPNAYRVVRPTSTTHGSIMLSRRTTRRSMNG